MSDTTLEFQGLHFRAKDLGSGNYSFSTHDISGGTGVADQSVEVQGYRILCHDNGDTPQTFSLTTTATTGATDVTVEWQGIRLKLHPTGGTITIGGVARTLYAVVVNAI